MTEMCSTCGLPEELCVCEDVSKTSGEVTIKTDERSFNKVVTIVADIPDGVDIDELSTELKQKFACGGTTHTDERSIELQGDHRNRLRDYLDEQGFEVAG